MRTWVQGSTRGDPIGFHVTYPVHQVSPEWWLEVDRQVAVVVHLELLFARDVGLWELVRALDLQDALSSPVLDDHPCSHSG